MPSQSAGIIFCHFPCRCRLGRKFFVGVPNARLQEANGPALAQESCLAPRRAVGQGTLILGFQLHRRARRTGQPFAEMRHGDVDDRRQQPAIITALGIEEKFTGGKANKADIIFITDL